MGQGKGQERDEEGVLFSTGIFSAEKPKLQPRGEIPFLSFVR